MFPSRYNTWLTLDERRIGAGTGLFTKGLLNHSEWASSIGALRAIEPSDGMRDVFAREIKDPRVKLSAGTFDKTGVPDAWADLIVIATVSSVAEAWNMSIADSQAMQAFHWCLDYDAALQEFARILKPDGVLIITSYFGDRYGLIPMSRKKF